jgi:hypothetical protein
MFKAQSLNCEKSLLDFNQHSEAYFIVFAYENIASVFVFYVFLSETNHFSNNYSAPAIRSHFLTPPIFYFLELTCPPSETAAEADKESYRKNKVCKRVWPSFPSC